MKAKTIPTFGIFWTFKLSQKRKGDGSNYQIQTMEHKIIENTQIGDKTTISDYTVVRDSKLGDECTIWRFCNIYGADIGDRCMVGSMVEIQENAKIGNNCRIQSHAFVCSQVTIEDGVFVSHGAKFVNDRYPPSGDEEQWEETIIRENASIGTNATLLPVEVGKNAIVGAGAVVTKDVPPRTVVAGNPAKKIGSVDEI